MTKQYILLTIGISASGKTTKAKELVQQSSKKNAKLINVNRDDLRLSLFGCTTMEDYKFSKAKEALITKVQTDTARIAINEGNNVIVSDTNLSNKTRNHWKVVCNELEVDYRELVVDTPVEECQKRNAVRANGVPVDVIYRQHKQFNDLFGEKYLPNKKGKDTIIVDIDGTLAHMDGRSPFDWKRVEEDKVDDFLPVMLKALSSWYDIVVLSGRDGCCRKETVRWLMMNAIYYDVLLMRPTGDCRPDTVIKKELLESTIFYDRNVVLAIDDRPCMVDMWNDLGIKCWAVGDQRIKF